MITDFVLENPQGDYGTITVLCDAPGTPPDVKQPTTCNGSALLNGTMSTVSQ